MSVIFFGQTFLLWFFVVLGLLLLIRRFIPWLQRQGRPVSAAILLISLAAGYFQGLGKLYSCLETQMGGLQRSADLGVADLGYFIADFMPVYKALGGRISPEMWEQVRRVEKDGPPCYAAYASKLLGHPADIEKACAAPAKGN